MKRILLTFCIITLFSCKKSSNNNGSCSNYVKGTLAVGLTNNAPLKDVFNYFNNYNLPITEIFDYSFSCPPNTDSLALQRYLETKPYFDSLGFVSVYDMDPTGALTVNATFFNMDTANQNDWLKTMDSIGLKELPGDTLLCAFINVPVGKETYWLNKLQNNGVVTWSELDCIETVYPSNILH
jgi:hypothetical protein